MANKTERGWSGVRPVSRRQFVVLAGISAAAVGFLGACGGSDDANGETSKFGDGDIGILNYLLTLEYLEAAFYGDVVKSGLFKGRELATLREFGEDEEQHVQALTKAVSELDGKPASKPRTEFPLKDANSALELASTVESAGAAGYLGQVPNVESPSTLATVLSIHSVEGRHASAINTMSGRPITPDGAFAKPTTMKAALESVEPFIAG